MPQYSGKIIRKNPVVPTQASASGVWTLADAAAATRNNTWPVAGVPNPISRSVRLRNSVTGYFSRTHSGTPTNAKKGTLSFWLKRGVLGAGTGNSQYLIESGTGTSNDTHFNMNINTSDQISLGQYSWAGFSTTAVFRDPSAWYHFVLSYDSTLASNNVILYQNGVQIGITSVTQNTLWAILNASQAINIGRHTSVGRTFDGYLTEVNLIDGQALTPSSFGTTDPLTGAWEPMAYTGTYGTNGFYLNFKDNTSTTTLGYDYSGNSNNWTANAISLTAGVTYDSMVDVPTLWSPYTATGEDTGALVRGNYCTLNPLSLGSTVTLSNGNLTMTEVGTYATTVSSIGVTSGKWYAEMTVGSNTYAGTCGIARLGYSPTSRFGFQANTWAYNSDGGLYYNSTQLTPTQATFTTGDVIGIAFDADNLTIQFYKNNTLQTQYYTAANSGLTAGEFYFATGHINSTSNWNFGQRPFAYTPPTGFKSLNTQNLPTPTISNGASYMAATLYAANGSTQTISNAVNGISMQPDFVWVKSRQYTTVGHSLFDALRPIGVNTSLPRLVSNSSDAETNNGGLTAFVSNGFSLNNDAYINSTSTGGNMIAWQWNAGGSTVTNTSGTISAQVRANATAGFSVVTYTGTGVAATIGHGLGVAPKMIIVKRQNSAVNWSVYNSNIGNTNYLQLNSTVNSTAQGANNFWNSTNPTSSVFSVGTITDTNASGGTYVAYCFAAVDGYSAFGSYTGNGSSDGVFVFLGLRARFLMIKRTDSTGGWVMLDTARDTYNDVDNYLYANSSAADAGSSNVLDINSNGFKIRNSWTDINANGGTYIYMAFAENPFKYSNAR